VNQYWFNLIKADIMAVEVFGNTSGKTLFFCVFRSLEYKKLDDTPN